MMDGEAEFIFYSYLDERNKEIRQLYKQGKTQAALAEEYGLSQSMISLILSGKRC